jgi:hypothetical protein
MDTYADVSKFYQFMFNVDRRKPMIGGVYRGLQLPLPSMNMLHQIEKNGTLKEIPKRQN